jgi:hypothetical protein
MDCKQMISKLKSMNRNNSKYMIENIYVFNSEMDLFVQKKNDYIIEYELKTTLPDFKKDFNKDKHDWMYQIFNLFCPGYNKKCPNKFYFVCPDNVIPIDLIPEYAGLIYLSNMGEKIVKRAPFLHKEKLSVEKDLFQKLYWRWVNEKNRNVNGKN